MPDAKTKRLNRLHRVRTLQLDMVRAEEGPAAAQLAPDQMLLAYAYDDDGSEYLDALAGLSWPARRDPRTRLRTTVSS